MQTRIRKLRKTRGWTLQQLADLIGTTPQTVQRLETANMTVSMDWLQKFANAFNVSPVDLMKESTPRDIECIGEIGHDGSLDNSLTGVLANKMFSAWTFRRTTPSLYVSHNRLDLF